MTEQYADSASSLVAPAGGGFAVTASDTTAFAQATRAIYVGTGGSLSVELIWGQTIVLQNVASGTMLPLRARKVLAATTASSIVGLY